jgi:outer membrane receptor protein involved in Fe transport
LIHRAPGGSLWLSSQGFVIDLPQNVGAVETRGIDGNISYSYRFGSTGTLSASGLGTYVTHYIVDDGLNPEYDCAGYYGATCGNPLPHWRHKLRLGFQMPNGIGISGQWRYIGKVTLEGFSNDEVLNNPLVGPGPNGVPIVNGHTPSQSYFDLAGTFTVGDHYNLRLGVNNIFDKNPPIFTSSFGACAVAVCNGGTYGGTYDTLGRFFFAGATLNF